MPMDVILPALALRCVDITSCYGASPFRLFI